MVPMPERRPTRVSRADGIGDFVVGPDGPKGRSGTTRSAPWGESIPSLLVDLVSPEKINPNRAQPRVNASVASSRARNESPAENSGLRSARESSNQATRRNTLIANMAGLALVVDSPKSRH